MSRLMHAPALVSGVLALSLCAGGCGGEDAGPRPERNYCGEILPLSDTPDPGSGAVDCSVLDGLELFYMDTFEVGEARSGWYINNDRTALSDPPPETDPVQTSVIPRGRCVGYESEEAPSACDTPDIPRGECDGVVDLESHNALRIRTGNLSANGGVIGRNFARHGCIHPDPDDEDTICPYRAGPPEVGPCSMAMAPSPPLLGCNAVDDMSDWDGVVIWARKAPGSQSSLRLRVSDTRTDEQSCICNPFTDENDTSDGCDKFGQYITLDNDFRAHLVPFREMQQGGWGIGSPGIDRSEIMSFAIEYGRGAWDVWLDDFAFYRSKE